ncbi:MAG: c-type cytochrome [Verrucomicrobiales bacterium]|nr:c-type cytochrome [Verrucomicrobiales bacterium]
MRILFLSLLLVTQVGLSQSRADKVQAEVADKPDAKWWEVMDTGPFISDTFRSFGDEGEICVLKGIAIKVGKEENHTFVFDTETMRMVAGFSGRVALGGTPWDGKHGGNSSLPTDRSNYFFMANRGPGWAVDGDWSDTRELDNGIPNGPLPDDQAEYIGLYRHADAIVLDYTVGGTGILEIPREVNGNLVRSFKFSKVLKPLQLLVSDQVEGIRTGNVSISTEGLEGTEIRTLESGRQIVNIPAGHAGHLNVIYSKNDGNAPELEAPDFATYLKGGPSLFPETIEVSGRMGPDNEIYSVDSIPLPTDNPWKSEIRFGAYDFFPDGKRVACSTWNGDVWIADGIDGDLSKITWRRYASGLFQTLGIKIVDNVIYTHGRDQLTRLHDLNDDGEADYYECFNNDVNITDGFHEFAFDLQTDKDGHFYFTKSQPVLGGGRGFAPWTEHNGTILKVTSDGEKLERLGWGLRAPGGIGLGPNGELTTGENEGSYVPRCKITWSKRPDLGQEGEISFHGVVPSAWDEKTFVNTLPGAPTDYERPLCWLPYYVDNSSGSQFWVPEDSGWNDHAGNMLHLSYGKSAVYRALVDEVDGQVQGGVYRLPIELTTAAMRGRFHPVTGDLYLIGFRGWQTNGGTGFQRVRFNGGTSPVPMGLKAHDNGIVVEFSDELDPSVASDPRRYSVSKWDYVWGPQYGSGRFSIDDYDDEARIAALSEPSKGSQNQIDAVHVRAASLLKDGKSVFLYIPDMTPAMQMEIKMDLATKEETSFRETIWNTVHNLRPAFEEHGLDLTNLPEINTAPIGEPGVILSMAHGSTDDSLVLDRLALTLGERDVFSPFIDPKRGNEVVFESSLIVESRDEFAFKLDGDGWASLKINGETILEGDLPLESPPLALEAGPQQLFCNFRRVIEGEGRKAIPMPGRIQLLWSGNDFIWEPVKPSSFRYLPNDLLDAKNKTRHGRHLFASKNCASCHTADKKLINPDNAMPELLEKAPRFTNIGNRLEQGWIEQWVRKPQNDCPTVAPDDAQHIAAYLATLKTEALDAKPGNAAKGEELAKTLHFEPWAEKLNGETKFTEGGLVAFLQNPAEHHTATTFPDLHLKEEEAADLAAWLRSGSPKVAAATVGDPEKGKAMVSKRCLVCHGDEKGASYEFTASPLSEMWEVEWLNTGCLSTNEANQPELRLTLEEKQALLAFRNVDSNQGLKSLNRFVAHEYATRTIEKLNCYQCHSGDNTLPDIALAGEKLRDEWLAGLFHGDVLRIRPYQDARMPGFVSRADKLAKGIAHRAGVDTGVGETPLDESLLEEGTDIAGLTGYACITCHAAGSTGALQAFEGQGPNLQLAAERLREDYYLAWMHWPQRFVPTTIMPKYTADKTTALNPTFYDGIAEKQFKAVWEWMKTLEGAENAPVGEKH